MDENYVKVNVDYCDGGFAYLSDNRETLWGFILFKIRSKYKREIDIDVLCSNKNVGSLLMLKSLEYFKNNNFNKCLLEAKNENTLPLYYEKFGFVTYSVHINGNGIECCEMELENYNILNKYDMNIEILILYEFNELEENQDSYDNIRYEKPKLNFLGSILNKRK